jgi:hypothetical protein
MMALTVRCASHICSSSAPSGNRPSFLNSAMLAWQRLSSSSVVSTVRTSISS